MKGKFLAGILYFLYGFLIFDIALMIALLI